MDFSLTAVSGSKWKDIARTTTENSFLTSKFWLCVTEKILPSEIYSALKNYLSNTFLTKIVTQY